MGTFAYVEDALHYYFGRTFPSSVPAFFVIAIEEKQSVEHLHIRNNKKELHSSRGADSFVKLDFYKIENFCILTLKKNNEHQIGCSFIIMIKKYKKISVAAVLTLIALNAFSVYLINQSIEIKLALGEIQDAEKINLVQQSVFLSTVFSAIVITLDIVCILFLLYLLHKFIFKTLKKSTPTK